MVNQVLSPKQIEVLKLDLPPYTILVGVTGSGKSWVANIKFFYEIQMAPKKSLMMLVGRTSESLYDNVIAPLLKIDGNISLEYRNIQGHQRLFCRTNECEVVCVGASTEGAEDRIQGKNIYLLYIDEIQKIPSKFIEMAVSRCRWLDENNKLTDRPTIATMNPSAPSSYVKRNIIDKIHVLKGKVFTFDFSDNPTIENPKEYQDNLAQKMTGTLRDNLVYGKYSSDESTVLPEFAEASSTIIIEHERPQYFVPYISIDLGYTDNTGAVSGYYDFLADRYIIEHEFLLTQPTILDIKEALTIMEANYPDKEIKRYSDNDLLVLSELNKVYGIKVIATKKDNKNAQVNNLRVLLQQHKILIHPRCVNLISMCETVSYNKSGTSYIRATGVSGEEHHFDLVDALIYFIRNVDIRHNPMPHNDLDGSDMFIDKNAAQAERLRKHGNLGNLAKLIPSRDKY